MCLAVLAIDQHPRFSLVIATNRDEHFSRPTAALGWWSPRPSGVDILSGQDLRAGGTWMGLSRHGRTGLLTNIRAPLAVRADAPSRGALVVDWLQHDGSAQTFAAAIAGRGYNGFNLLVGDAAGRWHWLDSLGRSKALGRGLYGLSNGELDEPWPKVRRLKAATGQALQPVETTVTSLSAMLFKALGRDTIDPDEDLPATGVPLAVERWLSPEFIRSPDGQYGTRCSTLLITERLDNDCVTHVLERTYGPDPADHTLRQERLPGWPAA